MIGSQKSNHEARILVVDDSPTVLQYNSELLIKHGYSIFQSTNGLDAYKLAIREKPDLILLDIDMPDADGLEVCLSLKRNSVTRNIPVIFLSGLTNARDKIKGFEVGGVDYITKPFDEAEALARVKTHLSIKFMQSEIKATNQELIKTQNDLQELNANLEQQVQERIQEIKQKNEKLSESERLLSKIAENFPNSYISIIEHDYTIGFTSGQEFLKQNLDPNDFIGSTLEQVFGEHTSFIKEKYKKTFNGEETRFDLFINNQHQLYKTVPLYNDQNKITKILSVVENITEQKEKELELQKAKEKAEECNKLKTEFLHNMSHEIRTPLNGIMGFTQMLASEDLDASKINYYTQVVAHCSNQLLRSIEDILEISTLETKQVVIKDDFFCLNELFDEVAAEYELNAREKNTPIHLNKELQDASCMIISDRSKLSRILSRLIENALKFTSDGSIEFGYEIAANKLKIYVSDTGIGISPDKQDRIFDRFSQEEGKTAEVYGGLGLGLSISRENAKLMGGDISVQSEKGKGSIFMLTIPYRSADKSIKIADSSLDNTTLVEFKNIKVLIAEDEDFVSLFLETLLLDMLGCRCQILRARNGHEAVELFKEHPDIDLVLMDLKMPIMNGLEAAKRIRDIHPTIPIIAQTAYSTKQDVQLAIDHGCNDFISKPIDKKAVYELIRKHAMHMKQQSAARIQQ